MHRNVEPSGSLGKLQKSGWAAALLVGGLALFPTSGAAQGVVLTEELERATFRAADLDGDGHLDEAEFAADVIAAFIGLDADGDRLLSPDEMVGVSAERFARIDIDGDGTITLDEVRLRKLGAFAAADRELTGRVSMAEMLFRDRRPE